MQRQLGISVACLGMAGLGAVADAGFVPIAVAIIFGCAFFLRGLFHHPEAEAIPRRRKMLAAFCAAPIVGLLLDATYLHQYGLYTPADLKSLDICIDTDIWGGSATMFGYVAIRCSSRDVLETLSSTELVWGWALLPPETLRYVFEGSKVVGVKIIERGTEYRLDRDRKCFVQIKGRRTGLVGDCYLPPYPYRLP